MKIAVIGTGNVGSTLGTRWAKGAHQVTFGSRDPNSRTVKDLLEDAEGKATADSIKNAVKNSDIILLSVPWESAKKTVKLMGNIEGKILIDCTNPLKNDLTGLEIGFNTSAAEEVAQWAKGAKVVKAFNSIGSQVMDNPNFGNDKAILFICGNQEEAKREVFKLAEELGFDCIDAGELSAARYLEQLAMFWIHLAFGRGMGSDFAFKMLKR